MHSTPAAAAEYTDKLTGDWQGLRSEWDARGVTFDAVYTADLMGNLSGGVKRGASYLSNLDLTATIDGSKLYGVPGSTVFLYMLNNGGSAFDAKHLGSVQGTNNIETDPHTTKLYEAWIEQNFLSDTLSLRAGLYDLNSEFYVTDSSGLLIGPTYGIGTEMAQSGVGGPSIFPTTALGMRAKWQPNENNYVMLAMLDGLAGDPEDAHGTQIDLGDKDGLLYALEASHHFNTARLAVGGWYYTAESSDLAATTRTHHNHGIYGLVEKNITENTTVFARVGLADQRVNQTDYAWATGLLIDHVLPSRDASQLSLAVSGAHNSQVFKTANPGVDTAETGIELTYSDQLAPWLRVQPDLQYVMNPGTVGTSASPVSDAWVIGTRVEISF